MEIHFKNKQIEQIKAYHLSPDWPENKHLCLNVLGKNIRFISEMIFMKILESFVLDIISVASKPYFFKDVKYINTSEDMAKVQFIGLKFPWCK